MEKGSPAKSVKAGNTACESIAPNKPHQIARTIGRGATKDAAETNLNDKVLELVIAARTASKEACGGGACDEGQCYTSVELNGQPTYRRARRGDTKVWLCIFQGTARSNCICVATA